MKRPRRTLSRQIFKESRDRIWRDWLAMVGVVLCCLGPAQADDGINLEAVPGRVLGRFRDRFGFDRIYVELQQAGPVTERFVSIAREWHRREPKGWFWFLDDAAKAKQLLASLPETEHGDLSHYPVTWVKAHTLGHIQMELLPGGGRRWVLMPGIERSGNPLAVLGP
jgi:hypothetical protein